MNSRSENTIKIFQGIISKITAYAVYLLLLLLLQANYFNKSYNCFTLTLLCKKIAKNKINAFNNYFNILINKNLMKCMKVSVSLNKLVKEKDLTLKFIVATYEEC